ncbi:MAG TPA: STAS domain-containing protein [Candidatus Aquilonibacter sp.]|nr:STAS domain-containing protein [Candidatus Aquilonibacter sp.]
MQDTTQAAFGNVVDPAGVFALVGDFDLFNAPQLEGEISSRLRSFDPLYLDFSACTYVDSSILSVLVRAVRDHGDRIHMIVPRDGNVARILAVTQLDRVFPIVA